MSAATNLLWNSWPKPEDKETGDARDEVAFENRFWFDHDIGINTFRE
jgi:hypothetical protein